MLQTLTATALAVLLLAVALLRADDPPKVQDKDLEGTWVIVSQIQDGKDLPPPGKGDMAIFEGDTLTFKTGDQTHKCAFKVDTTKTPRWIDVIPEDGPLKGKTVQAAYEVKDDELRVCHGEPGADRPKELSSKVGSGNVLITLKRVKK